MSSRKYEVDHDTQLRELLSQAGLRCARPPPPSTATSESEEVVGTAEESNTEVHEEEIEKEAVPEETSGTAEESPEAVAIFPTPSLRRLIPEEQRRIEELYTADVLPARLSTNFAEESIPVVAQTPPGEVVGVLGTMTGCRGYETNLAEFWFLDTLAGLLRRAQQDQMDRRSQAVAMAWLCVWMREMRFFDAADHQRMIRRFQENITAAAKFIAHYHRLPTPDEVGIIYDARNTLEQKPEADDGEARNVDSGGRSTEGKAQGKGKKGGGSQGARRREATGDDRRKGKKTVKNKKGDKSPGRRSDKSPAKGDKGDGSAGVKGRAGEDGRGDEDAKVEGVQDENEAPGAEENFECALVDLTLIAHYIFDLFSTDYQYQLVRMVFTFPPECVQRDAAHRMSVPRRLLGPQPKQKPVPDKDSTRTSLVVKKDRAKKVDDYGKLLELQEREERALAEQELKDRAGWLRRTHILPLAAAREHPAESPHRSSAQSDNSDRRDRR